MFLGGNGIYGAGHDSRTVLAQQSYLLFLPCVSTSTFLKYHNPQELSLFKINFQETLAFIRVPLGHFMYGAAFG